MQLLPNGGRSKKATARWLVLGGVLGLSVACAEGKQDNAPPDGFGTGATNDGGSTGSGSAGNSGSSAGSIGSSGSTGSSGSASAGSSNAGSSNAGSSNAGSSSAGSSSGGSGGSLSSGGSSGSSTGGKGGSAGSAGSATGGTSGSGSAGTSSGGGGTAGSVANGGSGGSIVNSGFTLQYEALQSMGSEAYISALIHATNNSTASVAVSQFKVRYYFTDEPKVQTQMTINYAHAQISGNQFDMTVTNTVVGMAPTHPTADTYIEFGFSCSGHPTLAPGEALDFAWQVQGPHPNTDVYTQTNDYSFNANKTGSLSNWDHVTLYQNDALAWGTPPG